MDKIVNFSDAERKGYDWDVINRMLRFEISQERFQELKENFTGAGTT